MAQALIAEGHVRIDRRRVLKPSETVRIGSIVTLPLHGTVRVFRVAALPTRRGPSHEARQAFEEMGDPADPQRDPVDGAAPSS